MGYRSDVAIEFTPKAFDMFKERIRSYEWWEDEIKYGELLKTEDNTIILKFSGTKWYDDFPFVKFVNDFRNKIYNTDDNDLDVCFVRTGEEAGDVESDYGKAIIAYHITPCSYIDYWGQMYDEDISKEFGIVNHHKDI